MNLPDFQKTPKRNPSKLEWVAVEGLKNDKNIEIEGVDKGGSEVILSKSPYKSIILLQLNDEKTYKKWNSIQDKAVMKEIKI